jgi:alcohol dehydrogenase (cytochrome c)
MVWALALAACRTSGRTARERGESADRQRLHVHDRRLGHGLQDRRAQPDKGEFVWVCDPGRHAQGKRPRTRGIALWEDLVLANLPDGRVIAINRDNGEIVWDKKIAARPNSAARNDSHRAARRGG